MLSENAFITVFDCIPFSLLKFNKKKKVSKVLVVVLGSILLLNLLSFGEILSHLEVVDIPAYLYNLNITYFGMSTCFNLWVMFGLRKFSVDFLGELRDLDETLGVTLSSRTDLTLFAILFLFAVHILSFCWFIPDLSNLYVVSGFMCACYITQLAFLKHMVSKRMAVTPYDDLVGGITLVRTVLSLDRRVCEEFSGLVMDGLAGGLLHFLFSVVAYWRVYGLHDAIDCYEYKAPVASAFSHGFFLIKVGFIAWTTTEVSESLSNFAWELQKKVIVNETSFEERSRVYVLQLELSHTSTDFTVLGLFSVDNSSVTNVSGFVVTCIMVFIQFLK